MENKAKLEPVSVLPDLYVWVSDDGKQWGVGELLLVNAKQWTDNDFEVFINAPDDDRWAMAKRITEFRLVNHPLKESDANNE